MSNIPVIIFIIAVFVICVVILLKIFKKRFKKIYIKLPFSYQKIIDKCIKIIKFSPYLFIIWMIFFCRPFDFSVDIKSVYSDLVENQIEDISDLDGYGSAVTDFSANISFHSNKSIRVKNIENFKKINYDTYEDSISALFTLNKFKRIFKHEDLNSCELKDTIIKEYYNEYKQKKRNYTRTRKTDIEYLLIKNKGLHFFMYSRW